EFDLHAPRDAPPAGAAQRTVRDDRHRLARLRRPTASAACLGAASLCGVPRLRTELALARAARGHRGRAWRELRAGARLRESARIWPAGDAGAHLARPVADHDERAPAGL